jgi:hypothetical protein
MEDLANHEGGRDLIHLNPIIPPSYSLVFNIFLHFCKHWIFVSKISVGVILLRITEQLKVFPFLTLSFYFSFSQRKMSPSMQMK